MTHKDIAAQTSKRRFVYNRTKKEKVVLWASGIFVVAVLIHLTVTVVAPLMTSSGADRFMGVEREAAQRAIDAAYYRIDNKLRWSYKITVLSVRPAAMQECNMQTREQMGVASINNTSWYVATLNVRELFTYTSTTEILPLCSKFY